jgi:hypothetical protein
MQITSITRPSSVGPINVLNVFKQIFIRLNKPNYVSIGFALKHKLVRPYIVLQTINFNNRRRYIIKFNFYQIY